MLCRAVGDNTAHLRLAELLRGLSEVEDVVDDLKRETQVAAVLKHGVLHRLLHAAENSRGPAQAAQRSAGVSRGYCDARSEAECKQPAA